MADQRKIQWDTTELPRNPKRRSSSGGRRLPSPFPHIDPWARRSVLSIDGGGIRGYSSLLILQALMERVDEIERDLTEGPTSSIGSSALTMPISDYRPCHYFDFIAGARWVHIP